MSAARAGQRGLLVIHGCRQACTAQKARLNALFNIGMRWCMNVDDHCKRGGLCRAVALFRPAGPAAAFCRHGCRHSGPLALLGHDAGACVRIRHHTTPSRSASQAIALRRDHVDLAQSRLWVPRLKRGLSVEHPVEGDELRAIRRWLGQRDDLLPWLFVSERRQPLTRQAVNYILAAAGERAGLGHIHPHMLRHSCGFALANRGYDLRLIQDYLGHRDPRHTARYTRTAASRFNGLW